MQAKFKVKFQSQELFDIIIIFFATLTAANFLPITKRKKAALLAPFCDWSIPFNPWQLIGSWGGREIIPFFLSNASFLFFPFLSF